MNPNFPTVPLIRDTKFQSSTEPAFFGTVTCPDGTVIQTLDPGGVAEQTVEMYFLPSTHLTTVHYKHVNSQQLQSMNVSDDEIASIIAEAMQAVPAGVTSFAYSKPGSDLPAVDVAFAYRGLHTKINDGSVSDNILMHGGNIVEDSKDCFLLGLQRALVSDHQGIMEKGLIASQVAKTHFEEKMGYKPFNLAISNAQGIQTSGSGA